MGPRGVQITEMFRSETILFACKAEHFPFNAQQNITILGVWIREKSDNLSLFLLQQYKLSVNNGTVNGLPYSAKFLRV